MGQDLKGKFIFKVDGKNIAALSSLNLQVLYNWFDQIEKGYPANNS